MIHVANNFISSKVHSELIREMARAQSQQVIVPVRRKSDIGVNDIVGENAKVRYLFFRNRFLRFFPILKVLWVYARSFNVLEEARFLSKRNRPSFVAHNFWSDGMVLFLYSIVRDIRFVMVVRNTDINIFIPKLPHYRWLMTLAIKRASGLVFVSQAHLKRFAQQWPGLIKHAATVEVIPNGVNEYWHHNRLTHTVRRPPHVCFVGKFDDNKNLKVLVRACGEVAQSNADFRLILAGGTEDSLKQGLQTSELPGYVRVVGVLSCQKDVRDLFRSCRVFAMPSLRETFGLVYIEALSQGCALVCTKNEGIDGMFDSPSVVSVDPRDERALSGAIIELLSSYPEGTSPVWVAEQLARFQWSEAAQAYVELLK